MVEQHKQNEQVLNCYIFGIKDFERFNCIVIVFKMFIFSFGMQETHYKQFGYNALFIWESLDIHHTTHIF